MGTLMIVLPAHVRNLTSAVREQYEKMRRYDKNQNVNIWLDAVVDGEPIDVLAGNR
jgi:hypothetical protein